MTARVQAAGLPLSEVRTIFSVLARVLGDLDIVVIESSLSAPDEGWIGSSAESALDAVASERARQDIPIGVPLIGLADGLLPGGSSLLTDASRAVGLVGDASQLTGSSHTRLHLWLFSIMKALCLLAPVPASCLAKDGCIRGSRNSGREIAAELADPKVCPECARQLRNLAGLDIEQGLRWMRGYGCLSTAEGLSRMGSAEWSSIANMALAPPDAAGTPSPALPTEAGLDYLRVVDHCSAILAEKVGSQVFSGHTVIILLHLLRDLVPFLAAFERLGLDPRHAYLICKPYPYADKTLTKSALEAKGYNVRVCEMYPIDPAVRRTVEQAWRADVTRPILVVEDGGFIAGVLHADPFLEQLGARCVGVVEQTRKGLYRWEQPDGQVPVVPLLNVAQCDIKTEFEPHLVARATVRNIQGFLPDYHFDGKPALVSGYGAIGRQVAHEIAHFLRMKVWVVDTLPSRRLAAYSHVGVAGVAPRATDLISHLRPKLVLGTTGKGSIDKEVIRALPYGAYVGSTSSDQAEIDVEAIGNLLPKRTDLQFGTEYTSADGSHKLFLLAEGYPINFYSAGSIANDSIDPILSLLLLAAAELVSKRGELRAGILTKEMNDLVTRYAVEEQFMYVHEL